MKKHFSGSDIRSDNGPEFTAKKLKKRPKNMDVKTPFFIEPGSP